MSIKKVIFIYCVLILLIFGINNSVYGQLAYDPFVPQEEVPEQQKTTEEESEEAKPVEEKPAQVKPEEKKPFQVKPVKEEPAKIKPVEKSIKEQDFTQEKTALWQDVKDYESDVESYNQDAKKLNLDITSYNERAENWKEKAEEHQKNIQEFNKEEPKYKKDIDNLKAAIREYNKEMVGYNSALEGFKANPSHDTTGFAYKRLVRWYGRLSKRHSKILDMTQALLKRVESRKKLIAKGDELVKQKKELENSRTNLKKRESALEDRTYELFHRKGTLQGRINDLGLRSGDNAILTIYLSDPASDTWKYIVDYQSIIFNAVVINDYSYGTLDPPPERVPDLNQVREQILREGNILKEDFDIWQKDWDAAEIQCDTEKQKLFTRNLKQEIKDYFRERKVLEKEGDQLFLEVRTLIDKITRKHNELKRLEDAVSGFRTQDYGTYPGHLHDLRREMEVEKGRYNDEINIVSRELNRLLAELEAMKPREKEIMQRIKKSNARLLNITAEIEKEKDVHQECEQLFKDLEERSEKLIERSYKIFPKDEK